MKRAKNVIEDLKSLIDELAGEGTYVTTNEEEVTREEVEFEIRAAFIREGCTPEEAEEKTKEFLGMVEALLLEGCSVN